MQIKVSGYGIPGYGAGKIIFNQHSLFLDGVFGGSIPADLKRIHFQPNKVIFVGKNNVAITVEGTHLFKAPSFKMADIRPKGVLAKAFKAAYKQCVDHNEWIRRTPRQYSEWFKAQHIVDEFSGIRLRISLGDYVLHEPYEGLAAKAHVALAMNTGGSGVVEKRPLPAPEWDDNELDSMIDYVNSHLTEEDIPF